MRDIYPIKGPVTSIPYLFYLLIGICGLTLLCIVLFLLWKKYKSHIHQYFRSKHLASKNTAETIDELVLLRKKFIQQIHELKTYIQSGEYDSFFQEITNYVKDFYGLCSKHEIKEMTSFEIKKNISCAELDTILETCDRIKFSKQTNNPESECHAVLSKCENFISDIQFNK